MQNTFTIPGISENKETLAQSPAIRLIPWLLVAAGVFSFVVYAIPTGFNDLFQGYSSFLSFLTVLLGAFVSLLFRYHFAAQIKKGDLRSIWIVRVYCIYLVLSALQTHFSSDYLLYSLDSLVGGLTSAYILYGLFTYEKSIVHGSKVAAE